MIDLKLLHEYEEDRAFLNKASKLIGRMKKLEKRLEVLRDE